MDKEYFEIMTVEDLKMHLLLSTIIGENYNSLITENTLTVSNTVGKNYKITIVENQKMQLQCPPLVYRKF